MNNNLMSLSNTKKSKKQYNPRFVRRFLKSWQLYVILMLPLAWVLLFSYGPMYGILLAFKRYSPRLGIWNSPGVGLTYFQQFFGSRISLQVIYNTFILSIYSIIASFPIPIILALALTEIRFLSYKRFVQMVVYAPYFISTVVLVGMMMMLLETRVGIVNRLLGLIGIAPINFMGKPTLFRHVYVWSGVWQASGYNCIVYIAALAGVSQEMQEAALIDGASKAQRIWHVDLPTIKPTITILLIMSFGYTMSLGFEKVFLMQNSLNTSTSEIISTYVYKVGLQSNNFGLSTAISLLNSVINMVLLLIANWIAKRVGETSLW
jgi:putative aldouronate transport system permease protein